MARFKRLNEGLRPVAATQSLTKTEHDGKTILLTSLTGHTITLPKANGVGTKIRMIEKVAPTSGSTVIKVIDSVDVMVGALTISLATGVGVNFPTAANSDTVTLNRTTSGGASAGEWLEFEDIAPGIWAVDGNLNGSGVLVTPFSATV
jgi:hypothetical protein